MTDSEVGAADTISDSTITFKKEQKKDLDTKTMTKEEEE